MERFYKINQTEAIKVYVDQQARGGQKKRTEKFYIGRTNCEATDQKRTTFFFLPLIATNSRTASSLGAQSPDNSISAWEPLMHRAE